MGSHRGDGLWDASTVGKHGDENMISEYVKKQGSEYSKLHESRQRALF